MNILQEINILNEKKLVIGLNVAALVLMVPFFYLFAMLASLVLGSQELPVSTTDALQSFWFLPVYFFLICIHELIHGLFFKVFNPEGQIKYGFKLKSMMAYATSPGSLYKRWPMVTISLAPFVLISLALIVLFTLKLIPLILFVLLGAAHAASCVGDFYYTYLLLIKHRKAAILVEDTETGLLIYAA